MTKNITAKAATVFKAPTLYVGTSAIAKAVDSIGRRSKGLIQDIQTTGLSILQHIDEHSDTTLADRLYIAMGKGSRRISLAQWFITYGKMRLLTDDTAEDVAAKKAGHIFKFDKTRNTNMPGAVQKPWQDMVKEQDIKEAFDVQAAYLNLMKRIASAQKNQLEVDARWVEALAAVKVPEVSVAE